MITTIISNNCMGGVICSRNNMQFKSPTVALQILPEEYPKFCANLKHYMETELVPYREWEYSHEHTLYLYRMYGKIPTALDFPVGLLDDIVICFQHYESYTQAKQKWDERKQRIEWDNIGYIFHARGSEYWRETQQFLDLKLPHSVALTNGFRLNGAYRFDVPDVEGIDDFGWYAGKYVIEYGNYNEAAFLRGEI